MKLLNNLAIKKLISVVVLFIALFFLGYDYYQTSQPNIWVMNLMSPILLYQAKSL